MLVLKGILGGSLKTTSEKIVFEAKSNLKRFLGFLGLNCRAPCFLGVECNTNAAKIITKNLFTKINFRGN